MPSRLGRYMKAWSTRVSAVTMAATTVALLATPKPAAASPYQKELCHTNFVGMCDTSAHRIDPHSTGLWLIIRGGVPTGNAHIYLIDNVTGNTVDSLFIPAGVGPKQKTVYNLYRAPRYYIRVACDKAPGDCNLVGSVANFT